MTAAGRLGSGASGFVANSSYGLRHVLLAEMVGTPSRRFA